VHDPLTPPAEILPRAYLNFLDLSFGQKKALNLDLNAKLNACTGKYLSIFVKLPLQKDAIPSCLATLEKQSTIPEYPPASYNALLDD